jgi:hypothetical protein
MTHADTKLNAVVLAASLRGESLNRRLAELSARIAERSGPTSIVRQCVTSTSLSTTGI